MFGAVMAVMAVMAFKAVMTSEVVMTATPPRAASPRVEPRAAVSRAWVAGGAPEARLPHPARVVATAKPRPTGGAADACC